MTNQLFLPFSPTPDTVSDEQFLLDTNVLITAHHDYYAPDLCPGFWQFLQHCGNTRQLLSIDRVRDEITGPAELLEWVNQLPASFFAATVDARVSASFSEMQAWAEDNDQFSPEAKEEFARVADGWLAAYARVHNVVLVTNEAFNPDVRKKVPLPIVCHQFNIRWMNTFSMLRRLGARFDWIPPQPPAPG